MPTRGWGLWPELDIWATIRPGRKPRTKKYWVLESWVRACISNRQAIGPIAAGLWQFGLRASTHLLALTGPIFHNPGRLGRRWNCKAECAWNDGRHFSGSAWRVLHSWLHELLRPPRDQAGRPVKALSDPSQGLDDLWVVTARILAGVYGNLRDVHSGVIHF